MNWNRLLIKASEQMRPFNDDLIYEYRKRKIAGIADYLDKTHRQVTEFFGKQVRYVGYQVMTPKEHIDYILDNSIIKGNVQIRRNESQLVRYEYEFEGRSYYVYHEIPYLVNEMIVYKDTKFFPQFYIVEKGGVNCTENGTIIVKVMRIPITFSRRPTDKMKLISTRGNVYPELLVTVKIHQAKETSKKKENPPLLLYHLCKWGFPDTMKKYGIDPKCISIVQEVDEKDKDNEYFLLPNGVNYFKVSRDILKDSYKLRAILSVYRCFVELPDFHPQDVLGTDPSYYITVLGKYTSSKDINMIKLLYPNAVKHLEMTDPMLDLVAKEQLRSVGCECNDIYDLLYWMYYRIDDLLVSYNPTNLFDKKIESLDNLAGGVASKIASAQYRIIDSKKATLDSKTFASFCTHASCNMSWISTDDTKRSNNVFRTNPSLYNDNYLLTIGLKRVLSLESITSRSKRKNRGKSKTSPYLLRAHPSQLVVTSILDIPASSPVVTGSMNPYCEIDDNGNIQRPPYASEIDGIFK